MITLILHIYFCLFLWLLLPNRQLLGREPVSWVDKQPYEKKETVGGYHLKICMGHDVLFEPILCSKFLVITFLGCRKQVFVKGKCWQKQVIRKEYVTFWQNVCSLDMTRDGSVIYGNNKEGMGRVRTFQDGKLKLSKQGLLQHDEKGIPISGDVRNCWAGFSLLQALFIKEHNSVCDMLTVSHLIANSYFHYFF